jgi:hypothetical protein
MRHGRNLRRYHLLLAGCCVVAGLYYLVVTLPLIRQEREVDERLQAAVTRLAAAGHGMTAAAVEQKTHLLAEDIDAFAAIGRDRTRTIRFAPEVEELLTRPFQRMDFEHRKFLAIDRIRRLSREREVKMPNKWEQALPSPGRQQPHQLWAQLAVMEQLVQTAIGAGVDSIGQVELLASGGNETGPEVRELEVAVRMQLTGPMEAIHTVLMMLPMNGDDLQALGLEGGEGPKSPLFLRRFIIRKSSAENADEVTLDFVASGFLDAAPVL